MVCFVHFESFWLGNVLRATTACIFSTSQHPKVVWQWCVWCILTWKCASCHNGVHSFDSSTSKSGPHLVCFVHFDLQMSFAPQQRALFRHRNFQKCSEGEVFLAFSLARVLRATTACNFSSLIWPDGSAPAAFRDFSTFSHTWIFFLLTPSLRWSSLFFSSLLFSLLLFSSLLWSSLTLPTSVVGSLTSKLPSISYEWTQFQ